MIGLNSIVDWIQDRIDIRGALSFLFDNLRKPIPKHANFLYTFGSLALFLFALQTITGTLMLVYYKPTVKEAYNSVLYIHETVPFGWLIRQIHVWGANLMVFVLLIHMVKTYFTGAYKKPRELTWMFGVVLFGIVLGFGFTGYLLPWDQLALWAVTVGTNMMGFTPVFGSQIRFVLLGSKAISGDTLLRWYVLHVLMFPFVTVIFMAVHFWRVRKDGGISGPL